MSKVESGSKSITCSSVACSGVMNVISVVYCWRRSANDRCTAEQGSLFSSSKLFLEFPIVLIVMLSQLRLVFGFRAASGADFSCDELV